MRTTITATVSLSNPSTEAPAAPQSPLHYPIPCLLGGLATMTILVISAVLILACSIWKQTGEGSSRGAVKDLEQGGESVKLFTDKVLVIMAGNENPTYLATPIPVCPVKATSFEEQSEKIGEEDREENSEVLKEASSSTDERAGLSQN